MVQLQSENQTGFCEEIKTAQSLYILAAGSYQLFGQGMTDIQKQDPSIKGLPNYKICTKANSDTFLNEFLTKINSNKLYSCQKRYSQRHDIRLQGCLRRNGLDK